MHLLLIWLVVAVAATLAMLVLLRRADGRRTRALERLRAERGSGDCEAFAAAFRGWNASAAHLAAVHDFFQRLARPVQDLPVRAEDQLATVYGLESQDRHVVLLNLLSACGLREPTSEEWTAFGPLERVGDIVEFLCYARAGYPAAWSRTILESPAAATG